MPKKINPAQIKLYAIRQIVRDYHYALDKRDHGVWVQSVALGAIQDALEMWWKPGEELKRREG